MFRIQYISVHSTTGYSPFFLMFGRQATIPVDLMYNLNQGQEKELPDYVRQLREGLKEAYALVRNRCESEHQRQKAIYDRKVHTLLSLIIPFVSHAFGSWV